MSVFDIPTERLLDLSDADLRELIARLCEAEREQQDGHRNDVRWGGSQTAADGGLDVVVAATTAFEPRGPLTHSMVGIQVKAGNMANAAIFTEMCPDGMLRPAIADLAAQGGAYLIACTGVTCSETMLKRREAAMRSATTNGPHNELLHVAFLDRNAISRWV